MPTFFTKRLTGRLTGRLSERLSERQPQITFVVLLTALVICSLLISFYNSTGLDIYLVSSVYIAFAYGLFAVLLAVNIIRRRHATAPQKSQKQTQAQTQVKISIPLINTALTLVLASCLLMVLENIPQYRLLYNSAAILGYAVLLFYVVSYVAMKMPVAAELIDQQQRRFYLWYAIFLLSLFLISLTMDQHDPYGPHFQLRLVFWLLLSHLLLSWISQLWKLNQQLRNERTNTELMLLKSQINPHFFFNTLNNLYGLAREKSDQTPDLILRLADLMRYTIYQGQRDSVNLQQEVAYLQNFIELQQVRFNKQLQVIFNVDLQQGLPQEIQLPPLLFINLLENAYKHGVEKLVDNAYVNIDLHADHQQLIFSVVNNFDPEESTNNPGIGLTNLRKRLALHYPDRHLLQITQTENCYSATLTLTMTLPLTMSLTDQQAKEH
ncbi:GHKL domain-containing protein [Rheinheimera riviphila]|uniref:GHKL domain-containing protein n=1 Tax=Rheinheimera riviphila TaxID=1834037 RepID=A0A437QLS7_9GAMM|nr:histidine kinase [Rheinheimera riviphila]RVU35476.1 GHKL domain-containing protein [Rheinheimera riviphila]